MKDYNDATGLLSVKHEINYDKCSIITLEYIKEYDSLVHLIVSGDSLAEFKTVLDEQESFPDFIKRMNILTGESTDKIASYVFDLKMYKESVRKNE